MKSITNIIQEHNIKHTRTKSTSLENCDGCYSNLHTENSIKHIRNEEYAVQKLWWQMQQLTIPVSSWMLHDSLQQRELEMVSSLVQKLFMVWYLGGHNSDSKSCSFLTAWIKTDKDHQAATKYLHLWSVRNSFATDKNQSQLVAQARPGNCCSKWEVQSWCYARPPGTDQ